MIRENCKYSGHCRLVEYVVEVRAAERVISCSSFVSAAAVI